jgi:ABC-type glutathione transport system ATPase component
MSNANGRLLSVRLSVDYPGKPNAIDAVTFELEPGGLLGLAGQSGSGKSTIALALLRLVELRGGRCRGSIYFEGVDLLALGERQLRLIRGRRMALVMQSPAAALNPALRLETQLREAWKTHSPVAWKLARREVLLRFERLGLNDGEALLRRYPSEVSVGQAQRVVIAMAALHRPALIIADEPTSALDPATRGEIVELFASLNREHGVAVLFISHDLESMHRLCPRVCVLEEGRRIA